jgi:hypothetical protein
MLGRGTRQRYQMMCRSRGEEGSVTFNFNFSGNVRNINSQVVITATNSMRVDNVNPITSNIDRVRADGAQGFLHPNSTFVLLCADMT